MWGLSCLPPMTLMLWGRSDVVASMASVASMPKINAKQSRSIEGAADAAAGILSQAIDFGATAVTIKGAVRADMKRARSILYSSNVTP